MPRIYQIFLKNDSMVLVMTVFSPSSVLIGRDLSRNEYKRYQVHSYYTFANFCEIVSNSNCCCKIIYHSQNILCSCKKSIITIIPVLKYYIKREITIRRNFMLLCVLPCTYCPLDYWTYTKRRRRWTQVNICNVPLCLCKRSTAGR